MGRRKPTHAIGIAIALASLCLAANAQASPDSDVSGKHVLVIPLSGAPSGDTSLDRAVGAAVKAVGGTPVTAKVRKSDIAAITGCAADATDCYDQIALTLGVDHIIFGKVTGQTGGDVVSLTLVGGGKNPRSSNIKLETGATRDQAFQAAVKRFLGEKPEVIAAPAATTTTTTNQPSTQATSGFSLGRVKTSSWAVLGGGVAAIGTGTILLLMARSKQSEVDDAPTDTPADLDHLADLESSGKSLTLWGNVFLIGGGMATIGGAWLVARDAKHTRERPRVTVTPAAVLGGYGVSFGGRF